MARQPGPFRKACGVKVTDWTQSYADAAPPDVEFEKDGETVMAQRYYETLQAEGARVVGVWRDEYFAGAPALTVNRYGSGKVVYLGSVYPPGIAARVLTAAADGGRGGTNGKNGLYRRGKR